MRKIISLAIIFILSLLSIAAVSAYDRGGYYGEGYGNAYGDELAYPYYDRYPYLDSRGLTVYTDPNIDETFARTRGYDAGAPYAPYHYDGNTFYDYPYLGPVVYDPVVFGGLGNSYYAGSVVGSGYPVVGSAYYPFGPIYRYGRGGSGMYSYNYGDNGYTGYDYGNYDSGYDRNYYSGYSGYNYQGYSPGYNGYGYGYGTNCVTGCPGLNAPINRPFGVGY